MARKRVLFSPDLQEPFRLSRSKVDLYLNCPRCFYLDRRLGVGQPSSPPFSLNNAVDELLKKEFDLYRQSQRPHPLCIENGIEAIPYHHPDLDRWRNSLHAGIEYCMPGTNLKICGGVDDVWINRDGELIIVDYKATSKKTEVSLDEDWQIAYKRQMEIYQWLFRRNGFRVNPTGYFVYCNGVSNTERFDAMLRFSIKVIAYTGSDEWIESSIRKLYECLCSPSIPEAGNKCVFCSYRQAAKAVE
jgi:CRISPR/Cas system-associated exonuclease Cas4 (RecB family)